MSVLENKCITEQCLPNFFIFHMTSITLRKCDVCTSQWSGKWKEPFPLIQRWRDVDLALHMSLRCCNWANNWSVSVGVIQQSHHIPHTLCTSYLYFDANKLMKKMSSNDSLTTWFQWHVETKISLLQSEQILEEWGRESFSGHVITVSQ